MIFRKHTGELIEINIMDYLTDVDYYKEIIKLLVSDNRQQ